MLCKNDFGKYFSHKVEILHSKTDKAPSIHPCIRLKNWLDKKKIVTPEFQIKPIDKAFLRKILKRLKGSRVHGVDWIDSFSLKIAAPILEDSLLHMINLSIRQEKCPEAWKP